jgi:biotin operon repressor
MKKTPATTTKRLSSPRQYRALRELMKGPRSVRELFDSIPCNGVPQLISSLRDKGIQIDKVERKTRDRDGRSVKYCVYVLNAESRRLAFRLFADYAG